MCGVLVLTRAATCTIFGFAGMANIYTKPYSIAGNVYLLPKSRVITNINATDAMKFAISGRC